MSLSALTSDWEPLRQRSTLLCGGVHASAVIPVALEDVLIHGITFLLEQDGREIRRQLIEFCLDCEPVQQRSTEG